MGHRVRAVVTLIAAAAIVSSCAVAIVVINRSENRSEVSGLVQGYLAPIAVALTLLGGLLTRWLSRGQQTAEADLARCRDAAAGHLRQQMLLTWRKEVRARGIELPAPVRVRWRWADDDVAGPREEIAHPAPPGLRPLGGAPVGALPDQGSVTALHAELYARLPHGRLVILGEAGSGKTAAMILLMLASLADPEDRSAAEDPVPVWLTLSSWEANSVPLLDWVSSVMARDHRFLLAAEYGPDAVRALLESERVALFLDGLDEMPPALRVAALHRLDEESGQLRIVISSRSTEYRQALRQRHWHNAAVIELLPPSHQVMADYLLRDQLAQVGQWRQVVDQIEEKPTGVVASALSSPLALSLARIIYRERSPDELIDSGRFTTPAELRRHLLAQYLVTAYPDARQREHAVAWLAWIARQMGSTRTLTWLHVPGWVPRRQRSLVTALVFGPGTGCLVGLAYWADPAAQFSGVLPSALVALGIAVPTGLVYAVVAVAAGFGSTMRQELQTMNVRRPARNDIPVMLRSSPGVVVPALLTCFLILIGSGPPLRDVPAVYNGLLFGAVAGWMAGLTVGILRLWRIPLSTVPAASARVSFDHTTRAVMTTSGISTIASGLTLVLATALSAEQRSGPVGGLVTGLVAGGIGLVTLGLTFELNAGLAVGLAAFLSTTLTQGSGSIAAGTTACALVCGLSYLIGSGPSLPLRTAEAVLRMRGYGRIRFNTLLNDAHDRQVLRQVGTLYEFRHAELQDHLAQAHIRPRGGPA